MNVGLPDIDEPALMEEVVQELQSVVNIPLQIDTVDEKAMEKALRIYNGKAMVNSVSGKKESMEKVFPLVKKYGGESVYKMMLSYCDKIYVTKVDRAFQADTYFPNLDEMSEWKMTQESEEQTCFDLEFCFTTYERC